MKKCFALLLCALLLLTGCHGHLAKETASGPDSYPVPESFDTTKNYTVTFWAKNDTNKRQTAVYEQAIRDFEKLYPNITVNMRLYTDYTRIYNDVITNIATDTTPNVCITYPDHIATYLTGENTVVPLDSFLTDSRFGLSGTELRYQGPREIVPQFLSECVIGSNLVALPYMRSTEACYVNKDYVEKLGFPLPDTLTWDFIWQVSEKAMEQNPDGTYKVNGQKVLIPFIYKSTDNMMIQSLAQLDAPYSRSDGTVELWNDTTKEILSEIASHVKSGAFSTFKISSYPANFFNAGQCIFAIDSTAGATWVGSHAPLLDISEDALVEFETVVMPIPQYDPENPKMISQGPSVCLFQKADSQEVLASWLFAQYLLTNSVQIGYAETEGYVPVTLDAQQSPEYIDYLSRSGEDADTHYSIKIDASRLLLDNLENTFVTPVFNSSASVRLAAGQLIEDTAKAVRRKQDTSPEGLEAIYANVSALYRLDSIAITPGQASLGPLPGASKALLAGLLVAWVGILPAFLGEKRKSRAKSKGSH